MSINLDKIITEIGEIREKMDQMQATLRKVNTFLFSMGCFSSLPQTQLPVYHPNSRFQTSTSSKAPVTPRNI